MPTAMSTTTLRQRLRCEAVHFSGDGTNAIGWRVGLGSAWAAARIKPFDGGKRAAFYEIDRQHHSVSRAGARKVWTEALAGLRIGTRWRPDTSRSGQPGGNMAIKPTAQTWRQIVRGPVS
jgi:hypothetical protein